MKKIIAMCLMILLIIGGTTVFGGSTEMITEWTIPSGDTTIKLPVTGAVNITVDWGDESEVETITRTITEDLDNFLTHTYDEAGTYDIKIKGTIGAWGLNSAYINESNEIIPITEDKPYYTQAMYLTALKQWGELGTSRYGFSYCENLKYVSGDATENTFDNLKNMQYMFYGCSSLERIDFGEYINTSKVTTMYRMFRDCKQLTTLDVSNFNTSNVTNMSNMFYDCKLLTNLDISKFYTPNLKTMGYMFYNCNSLTSLDVSNFNTSNVTDMDSVFYGCSSLTELDLSNFDTSKVTTMYRMFRDCKQLTTLDVSNFNTSNVTNMSNMFYDCKLLTNLDISKFYTPNLKTMGYMFYNCNSLTSLDASNFNTSNVTGMDSVFYGCSSLTELDLSNFDTSKVTTMYRMFRDCKQLTTLDVSNWNTSSATTMANLFNGCTNLKSILVSNNFTVPTTATSMFTGTTNLKKIMLTSQTPSGDQFANASSQLGNITFYVPNEGLEDYRNTWSIDDTDATKIQPIIELNGSKTMLLTTEDIYLEKGYTLLEETLANAANYFPKNYSIVTTGEVNTTVPGTYKLKHYVIKIKEAKVATTDLELLGISGDIIEEVTRTVVVAEKGKLMITEWTIPAGGTTIKLPLSGTNMEMVVDWGDGKVDTVTENYFEHKYENTAAKTFEIKVSYVAGTDIDWGYKSYSSVTEDSPFYTYTKYLTKLTNWGDIPAIEYGFANCENLIEVSGNTTINTFKNVTDMAYMFCNCYSLKNVNTSNFNTSNVTNMAYMFYYCRSLTNLDLSTFDTSKVTYMNNMFQNCLYGLKTLDLSSFNTSNVEGMVAMFLNCISLKTLDLSSFNTSNVENMSFMFYKCSELTSLDLSNFDTSNVTNMESMFSTTKGLNSILISNKFKIQGTTTDMLSVTKSSLRFITVSTEPVANQFKGLITGDIKLYVPNGSLDNYKTILNGDTPIENIKPILESTDGENIMIIKGQTYDMGTVTVAGFDGVEEAEYYEPYGYKLIISGDLDTNKGGKYRLQYILKRTK